MTVLLLLLLAVIVIYWYEILRIREHVINKCQRICHESGFQFLDQSVAMVSIKIRIGNNGFPEFFRIYQFEYSENGTDRFPAYVDLINNRITDLRFIGNNGETTHLLM